MINCIFFLIFFSSVFSGSIFSLNGAERSALIPLMLLKYSLFLSSELSYFTFQLAFLFSTFFFKAPIHSIELFTGCSSCYCLYHIHYLTSFQYILFFSIWSGIILLIQTLIQWFFLVVFSIHYFLYVFYSQLATLRFALLLSYLSVISTLWIIQWAVYWFSLIDFRYKEDIPKI